MDASVRFDQTLLALESEHTVHAMLELVAPPAPDTDRPSLHVALVIDRSGSMHGPKLEAAKKAGMFLAERLGDDDELAVVSYDDEVALEVPLTAPNSDTGQAIATIRAGGMTNLSGGWLKGLEEARRSGDEGVRRVLLLSDGLANVGITDPEQLAGLAGNARDTVGTTTIGFGEGFDEDLLAAMADAGGGSTYFAETPEDAPGIFADEFEGLSSVVAQNVSVEVHTSEDVKLLGVLNEYPIDDTPDGPQVQLGDAYGGEKRRVVCKFHVPNVAALGPCTLAEFVLRYVSVGDEVRAHTVTLPLVVNVVNADEAAEQEPDQIVHEEVLLLEAAKARQEAIDLADRGDFDGAAMRMESLHGLLSMADPSSERVQEFAEESEQLRDHAQSMRSGMYSAVQRKKMRVEEYTRRKGR